MKIAKKIVGALLASTALIAGGIASSGPALATELNSKAGQSASVAQSEIDPTNPVLPEVREKIKAAGGGGVLATWTASYVPIQGTATKAESLATAAAAPSDCTISGVVYFTYRATQRSSVYNDGVTYCPGAVGITMNLGINKEDTVFGTVSRVASGTFNGNGPEVKGEIEYSCPTGNVSGFQATATGTLTRNGTAYGVAQGTQSFKRYNCG